MIHPSFRIMKKELTFGNDMSRIVRGIAIILMVTGHSLPGKIIGFAVPLFSFLVGYGYAFAKDHSWRNSLHRVWHLLSNFWIILFCICLPAALISYPIPLKLSETVQGMFGLCGRLNFYAWYIYFYIFAMAVMPGVSRVIDRFGLKGALAVAGICGLIVAGILAIPHYDSYLAGRVAYRCFRYLPIVAMAYYLAKRRIFSRLHFPSHWIVPLVALAGMVGVYFLRGVPYAQIFDLLWAPLFAALTAMAFSVFSLRWLRVLLTELGMKSMHIWFLHALFFTHATKGLFGPLVGWIHFKPLFILAVLGLSYLMAILIDKAVGGVKLLCSRIAVFWGVIPEE